MTPFAQLAPVWLPRLKTDLGLTDNQACGILGNLGFESGGFTKLQEEHPLVEGSLGGAGAAQWTGARRTTFVAWCAVNKLGTASDEGNYGYLVHELKTSMAYVLPQLRKTLSLDDAVFLFGRLYEAPYGTTEVHLPGFDERLAYARQALVSAVKPPAPPQPITGNIDGTVAAFQAAARDLQTGLKALGLYTGVIDSDFGPASRVALQAYQQGKS